MGASCTLTLARRASAPENAEWAQRLGAQCLELPASADEAWVALRAHLVSIRTSPAAAAAESSSPSEASGEPAGSSCDSAVDAHLLAKPAEADATRDGTLATARAPLKDDTNVVQPRKRGPAVFDEQAAAGKRSAAALPAQPLSKRRAGSRGASILACAAQPQADSREQQPATAAGSSWLVASEPAGAAAATLAAAAKDAEEDTLNTQGGIKTPQELIAFVRSKRAAPPARPLWAADERDAAARRPPPIPSPAPPYRSHQGARELEARLKCYTLSTGHDYASLLHMGAPHLDYARDCCVPPPKTVLALRSAARSRRQQEPRAPPAVPMLSTADIRPRQAPMEANQHLTRRLAVERLAAALGSSGTLPGMWVGLAHELGLLLLKRLDRRHAVHRERLDETPTGLADAEAELSSLLASVVRKGLKALVTQGP